MDLPPRPLVPLSRMTPEMRKLELQTFPIAFESILESLADGRPFSDACQDYNSPLLALHPTRFRTWIFRDEKRRNAYHMAKAMGAESIEDEMIRIADGIDANGNPTIDDVQRSKLMVDTRKWVLQVNNRRKYGDVKHIEQNITSTTSIADLTTDDLRQRLLRSLGMTADDAEFAYMPGDDQSGQSPYGDELDAAA